jgi:hypothetical protein
MQNGTDYSLELVTMYGIQQKVFNMHVSSKYINLLVFIGLQDSCSLLNHSQTGYNYHDGKPVGWPT